MIISVSRRTDIPAFYSDWFFQRLQQGFCYVPNPRNPLQIAKIPLNQEFTDAFVFWTKNPYPMLKKLPLLKNFPYYFQYTITSYTHDIEKNLPRKRYLVDTFKKLSELIGKHRIIWRYDPILLNEQYTIDYHIKYFEILCKNLAPYTTKVIVSFLSLYRKNKCRCDKVKAYSPQIEEQYILIKALQAICFAYNIRLEFCAGESININDIPINPACCIDIKLINTMRTTPIIAEKDKGQREGCGCVKSFDIGMYNSCFNGCIYCYAAFKDEYLEQNKNKHNPNSPLLLGNISPKALITEKNINTLFDNQLSLL